MNYVLYYCLCRLIIILIHGVLWSIKFVVKYWLLSYLLKYAFISGQTMYGLHFAWETLEHTFVLL